MESNNEAEYEKLVRVHDNTIKQMVRSREAAGEFNHYVNRLENYIYVSNADAEKGVKDKIEKEFATRS